MTDWAVTRLTITGPRVEIDRCLDRCIREIFEEGHFEELFDFNALVPMPDEVKLTMLKPFVLVEVPSGDPVSALNWYHWSSKHWGTKWLPSGYVGEWMADNIYDCIFSTPWRCPHPVIKALAIAYPKLKGFTVSHIHSDDTGEIGVFADGTYQVTEIESDYICDDALDCGCACECDCADYVQPEISRIISRSHNCWEWLEADVDDALAWARNRNAITRLV